ncbi:MAG: MFS transporter [Deferrisomatales bacterium]
MDPASGAEANPSPRPSDPCPRSWDPALRRAVLLCFFSTVLCFLDRVNISVAAPMILRDMGWDEGRMGVVFSAFFLGYVIFMIPGGVLADRLGGRRALASGVAFWSMWTVATPWFTNLWALSGCRYLVGAGQGLNFPSVSNLIAQRVPLGDRAKIQGFVLSGATVGLIVGLPLGSWIAALWGWPAIFYAFGGAGALWLALWLRLTAPGLGRPTPAAAPEQARIPWRVFLTHRSPVGLAASYFCHNYASYFLLAWLPTYLMNVHGFSLQGMGLGAALPAAVSAVSMNLSGWSADRLLRRGRSRQFSLKLLVAVGMGGSALFLAGLLWVRGPWAALAMIVLATGSRSLATPAYWTLSMEMAPRHAGILSSLMNTSGNLAGVVAPALTGALVARLTAGWDASIALAAAVSAAAVAVALPTVEAADVTETAGSRP